MNKLVSDPSANLGAMLLDISRPDGVPARTAVVLGSIENAHMRLLWAAKMNLEPVVIARMAMEEIAKIFDAKAAYDKALGL